MKNNKGISLISLAVMIVIMVILAAIAMWITFDTYDEGLRAKGEAERMQVANAISGRFGDYQRNNTASPLLGLVVPPENSATTEDIYEYIVEKFKNDGKLVTEDEIENQTLTKQIRKFVLDNAEDMKYTRILVSTDLLELGMENTNLNAMYLVNYYSTDVVGPIT